MRADRDAFLFGLRSPRLSSPASGVASAHDASPVFAQQTRRAVSPRETRHRTADHRTRADRERIVSGVESLQVLAAASAFAVAVPESAAA